MIKTEELVKNLYLEGHTPKKISILTGIKVCEINKIIDDIDISRTKRISKKDVQIVNDLAEKGINPKEIAEITNLSYPTVYSLLDRKYVRKQNSIKKGEEERVYKLHTEDKMTYREIAKLYDVSYTTVWRCIKRYKKKDL